MSEPAELAQKAAPATSAATRRASSSAAPLRIETAVERQEAFRESVNVDRRNRTGLSARFAAKGSIPAVVQRKVAYANGQFTGDSERPAWRAPVKKKTEAEARNITGKTTGKINFTDEELDRSHVYPFDQMEKIVVDYLNDPSNNATELDNMVSTVIGQCVWAYQTTTRAKLKVMRIYMGSKLAVKATVIAHANGLLSLLNSAPENVRAGNAFLNRSVGNNADPISNATPQKTHARFDDQTKAVLKNNPKLPIAVTPKGTTIISSDGAVRIATLTPASKTAALKAPHAKAASQSAAVTAALAHFNPNDLP